MITNKLRIPFAGREIELPLPSKWEVIDTLIPHATPGLKDLDTELEKALSHPIECPPLTRDDVKDRKIVLAVDDITRPTPIYRYFGTILAYFESLGASRENMTLIPGTGTHVQMKPDEIERKLGKENLESLRCVHHDQKDMSEQVNLGTTSRGTEVLFNRRLAEADLILCIGAVEPHALLGFGGGLKMILPGLAHETTIGQNHMQGITPEKFNYIGSRESPMRDDIEEAVGMLNKRIFIVNAVMNEKLEICRFVCGDPIKAQRKGADIARSISGREIQEKADVIILTSNPLNADLRQGMKCIGSLEPSLKSGGLIIALLECDRGVGDVTIPPKTLPHWLLRLILKIIGRNRVLWFVDKVKRGAGIEERFLSYFSLQVIREKKIYVYSEKLPPDTGKRTGIFKQYTDVKKMMRAAKCSARRRAKVYVIPHGGVTFPLIKGFNS